MIQDLIDLKIILIAWVKNAVNSTNDYLKSMKL